jgi:putative hydrolase of the HAD superfamily
MIKAVVFDLDNTLVDFMAMKNSSVDAAIRAMIDAGLRLSFEEVKAAINEIYTEMGIEYQRVFDSLLQKLLGKVDYKILAAGVIAYRRAREAMLIPYPHVHITLFTLARMGLKLGVVSDAPPMEAWLRLSYLNLHHIFDAVVTFDDTGQRKPSSAPFLTVLSKLEVEPAEAIMVGDWEERDIYGAAQVGMLTAFARYGDTFGTAESRADIELTDISDILAFINEKNGTA